MLNKVKNETEFVGGIVGEALDSIGASIKNGIVAGFAEIIKILFSFLDPILYWGCQIVIVYCVIIYFSSKDKKSVSVGMKAFLIFITFLVIRSYLI